jgi:hypothetical protein
MGHKGKKIFECVGKKVIGKPCEGKLHARFDEGMVDENPLFYSTIQQC